MSIESAADWRGLRRAAEVARQTFDRLSRHVRAGVTTGDLDLLAATLFARDGARSAPALECGVPRSAPIVLTAA
jgi:methionyl aminopeptidase